MFWLTGGYSALTSSPTCYSPEYYNHLWLYPSPLVLAANDPNWIPPALLESIRRPPSQPKNSQAAVQPAPRALKKLRGGAPFIRRRRSFYLSNYIYQAGVPLIHQNNNNNNKIPERNFLVLLLPVRLIIIKWKRPPPPALPKSFRVCLIEQHNEIFILLFYCHVTLPVHLL